MNTTTSAKNVLFIRKAANLNYNLPDCKAIVADWEEVAFYGETVFLSSRLTRTENLLITQGLDEKGFVTGEIIAVEIAPADYHAHKGNDEDYDPDAFVGVKDPQTYKSYVDAIARRLAELA